MGSKESISSLLSLAGININGNNPWDIKIFNDKFFHKALEKGSIGVGEAYVEKWWDVQLLDEFFFRVLKVDIENKILNNWQFMKNIIINKIFNKQLPSKSFKIGHRHYDIGNNLFVHMLDKNMAYTCGYWKGASTLDEAQTNKLEITCRKLNLKPGMHILDIGCGWGSFAKYASENFDVKVTGITVSAEQVNLANEKCQGLPVDIQLMDYRSITGKYDHVVSLGMFEHVGYKNYSSFMKVVEKSLKPNGLFLLHTIGSNTTNLFTDPWVNKYIFPDSLIPSIKQISQAFEGVFVMEDWHNFGADYDKTLMAWYNNFVANWDEIKRDFDEKFYRIWKYYLLMCAGSFRARKNQLWQIVLSKNGVPGGYASIR